MKCFELVYSVLEEMYSQIPGATEDEKDTLVLETFDAMSRAYQGLIRGNAVNHADLVGRFAYIYMYVTSHANMIYQIIQQSDELKELFEQDILTVSCLGGGPGSDFLGILKHLLSQEKQIHLNCNLFDKENAWNECWSDIGSKVPPNLRFNTNFETVDITSQNDWREKRKFLQSDLFTMSFFMSEVFWLKDTANDFFENLFSNAKQGAIFLFVDNKDENFYGWFDSLIEDNNFEVLLSDERRLNITDYSEEKKLLGRFYEKFGDKVSPKLTSSVAFRVCRKL